MGDMIGVILVGHGSSKHYNSEVVKYFADKLRNRYPYVDYAFIQINKPSLNEALLKAVSSGIESLVIQPVFLTRGAHVDHDIPRILGLSDGAKKGKIELMGRSVNLIISEPIGMDDRLVEILSDRIEEALRT
ncbi:MAG: sirohydrochlorin nickelochelatase [Candidatus Korarchaeum sp.]|nr:sirohydrochlorin nickelochelatase [Candidatus Korarchaeum sp.]